MQKLSSSGGCGKYAILLFGLLWTGISCVTMLPIAGGMLAASSSSDDPASMLMSLAFPLAFGGCFVAVGLAFIIGGLRPIIAGARVSKPEVAVSNSTLRSGEEFTLDYQQMFKAGTDVERITIQLILRESATYRRGTDTVTVTHDHIVQSFETPARHFEGGETFNDRRRMIIPRGAMHTFEAYRNKLAWLVKVKVEIKGWPDFDEEYSIRVLPEMV
ncbi:MAG: hypothetical protein FJ030_17255 [Chloroflexi bacterium]|nr:hypothetical protein [Chloroflexota bacterium]